MGLVLKSTGKSAPLAYYVLYFKQTRLQHDGAASLERKNYFEIGLLHAS